jgi:hypothetical protein
LIYKDTFVEDIKTAEGKEYILPSTRYVVPSTSNDADFKVLRVGGRREWRESGREGERIRVEKLKIHAGMEMHVKMLMSGRALGK